MLAHFLALMAMFAPLAVAPAILGGALRLLIRPKDRLDRFAGWAMIVCAALMWITWFPFGMGVQAFLVGVSLTLFTCPPLIRRANGQWAPLIWAIPVIIGGSYALWLETDFTRRESPDNLEELICCKWMDADS